jgi:dTDP-4-amino-4,6-dideoxygalactose transaminase
MMAVFHYLSLHKSPITANIITRELPLSDMYSDCLVRLPLYFGLEKIEQEKVIDIIKGFIKKGRKPGIDK